MAGHGAVCRSTGTGPRGMRGKQRGGGRGGSATVAQRADGREIEPSTQRLVTRTTGCRRSVAGQWMHVSAIGVRRPSARRAEHRLPLSGRVGGARQSDRSRGPCPQGSDGCHRPRMLPTQSAITPRPAELSIVQSPAQLNVLPGMLRSDTHRRASSCWPASLTLRKCWQRLEQPPSCPYIKPGDRVEGTQTVDRIGVKPAK